MAGELLVWWALLCAVSAANVVAWVASARAARSRRAPGDREAGAYTRLQLLLSAGYVLGCGYRSMLPVFDVERQVLFDSWLSSVIVGRSVATVAELCFAAQWALVLGNVARATNSAFGIAVSRAILPLITAAELFSWHAVLTTSNLGHVIEETIWGSTAAFLVASLAIAWPRFSREFRPLALGCGVAGSLYVAYMFGVDVPMYWQRWVEDQAEGREYLGIAQGAVDASTRWVVSHDWNDWKTEVVWMSLYFSVAVWFSIALARLPRIDQPRLAARSRSERRRFGRPGYSSIPATRAIDQ